MRSLIVFSALCLVVAYCGYPVAYPTAPPAYPVPKYPSAPTYSAPPSPTNSAFVSTLAVSDSDTGSDYADDTTTTNDFRKRAKARTVQNRQLHHRRALQPIRRFQKKAKQ